MNKLLYLGLISLILYSGTSLTATQSLAGSNNESVIFDKKNVLVLAQNDSKSKGKEEEAEEDDDEDC